MEFHDKGYGRTVELLQPIIDGGSTRNDSEYEQWVETKHWVNSSILRDALSYFDTDLPLCIFGFSAYKFENITEQNNDDIQTPEIALNVSCIPDYKFKGPGTQKHIYEAEKGVTTDGNISDDAFSVRMTLRQPNFTARVEELEKYSCGLSVGDLIERLEKFDDSKLLGVCAEENMMEIVRVRQDGMGEWNTASEPAPVELEIADVWPERRFQIFCHTHT